MSPYLFNLYINNLSKLLNETNVGCFIGLAKINHLMYADDIMLTSSNAKGLQSLLFICATFGFKFNIKFNRDKCKVMVFSNFRNVCVPNFILNNDILFSVTCYKYLGIFLCSNSLDDIDISSQVSKVYSHGNSLITMFKFCTVDVKIKLFMSFCASFYASQL